MGYDSINNSTGSTADAKIEASEDAAAACARTLANDMGLQIADAKSFAVSSSALRGLSDAIAVKRAYHDADLHRKFLPADQLGKRLYAIIEKERYEALGANLYKGVGQNLDECWQFAPQVNVDASPPADSDEATEGHIAGLCRRAFRAEFDGSLVPATSAAQQDGAAMLQNRWLRQLADVVHDQAAFAALAAKVALQLAAHMATSGGFDASADADPDAAAEPNEDESSDADDTDAMQLDDSTSSEDADAEESAAEGEGDSEPSDELPENAVDEAPIAGPDPTIVVSGDTQPYKPYTTDFDEIELASQWADTEQLAIWREDLDQHIAVHGRLVRRLAARLQRVLLARQKRHWQFDLEEGQLDSARLSRILSDPLMPLSFKAESETAFRNTTITLLIDNSRSMLGRPIMIAAACADILARTLERCGVSVEILGFTTVHLHGGSSTERWEQQGKPDNPGRLNDLRHIVYKSADMPYRTARRNLGLMLDKDILKQNIDGEALTWAYQRLMKRPEERRILITISDGAPVDTSTLGANAGDYLARHLQRVVDDIEDADRIELMAIGIGHDVSRFYSQAVSVFDARQLGPVMLDELEKLFRRAA